MVPVRTDRIVRDSTGLHFSPETNTGDVNIVGDVNITGNLATTSLTLTDLTATRLVQSDASKALISVADLTAWIAGTTNQFIVADDGDGTLTGSLPQDIHTEADPVFNSVNLGSATQSSNFPTRVNILDLLIDSDKPWWGLSGQMSKTAGATNRFDDYQLLFFDSIINQNGGTIGNLYGTYINIDLTDGDVGDAVGDKEAIALRQWLDIGSSGGKVFGEAYGIQSTNIIRTLGEVTSNVFGIYNNVAIENSATVGGSVYGYFQYVDAGTTTAITGNVYGLYLDIDNDTAGNTTYQIYSNERSNIDWFLYQNGTAPSLLGGTLTTQAGRIINRTSVTTTPYTVLASDHHISVTTASTAITLNLPAIIDGTEYHVKDQDENAAGKNITVSPDGSDTVENAASLVINTNGASVTLVGNSTTNNWEIQ